MIKKTSEAISIKEVLQTEMEMIKNVQTTLLKPGQVAFTLTFIWLRLLEKKIEKGLKVDLIMDNPRFA